MEDMLYDPETGLRVSSYGAYKLILYLINAFPQTGMKFIRCEELSEILVFYTFKYHPLLYFCGKKS